MHFEDVARAAGVPGETIGKLAKAKFPLSRSLLDALKGDATLSAAEKLLKSKMDPKNWYQRWETRVGAGAFILAAIIVPFALWLWPKSPLDKGMGNSSSAPGQQCDSLCRFLNDPSTAPIAGGISWLSMCCCCCCCCMMVMMIVMGSGGGGGNDNFL